MRSRMLAILGASVLAVVLFAAVNAHATPPRAAQKIFLQRSTPPCAAQKIFLQRSIDAQNAKVRA